jgi:hypothetical protein
LLRQAPAVRVVLVVRAVLLVLVVLLVRAVLRAVLVRVLWLVEPGSKSAGKFSPEE